MKRILKISGILSVVLVGLTQIVFAWSAWNWTSRITPFDLLPWMIVLAITIETLFLFRYTKEDFKKTVSIVTLVNCLSLVAPYGLEWLMSMSAGDSFFGYIEQWRIYTISWGYGILTGAVEIPILYRQLKTSLEKRKLLSYMIEINLLTTTIIFLIERMVCEGAWLSM